MKTILNKVLDAKKKLAAVVSLLVRISVGWINHHYNRAVNENCYEKFRKRFANRMWAPFIELEDGKIYSFADLEIQSGRIAHLFKKLGLRAGERIIVQAEKSPDIVFLYAACLRYGTIFVPIDTTFKQSETEHILNDATPALIVCQPEKETMISEIATRINNPHILTLGQNTGSLIEKSARLSHRLDVCAANADDIACILYTSGTTGRPKGAMLTHKNLILSAKTFCEIGNVKRNDVLLHALHLFHGYGLFAALDVSLYSSCKMIFLPRFNLNKIIGLLPKATIFIGTPIFYQQLLGHEGLNESLCRNTRLFISGTAPLPEKIFYDFKERTGKSITNRYGMTETTSSCTAGTERAGNCGQPIPGIELRVTGKDGHVLTVDQIGTLEVRGQNVFKGYWQDEKKTRDAFRSDGFFITSDIGRIDANGEIWLVGRLKDMILFGSQNVYAREVESYIDNIEGVEASAVFGIPHPKFGECVVAAVELKSGHANLTPDAILAILKNEISQYKIPKRIFLTDILPRNTMGKLQRNLLSEKYKDIFVSSSPSFLD